MFKNFMEGISGKKKQYITQITSFDHFQLELEYCFKKSGSKNNVIIENSAKLIDEPENEYDSKALAIYLHNLKIGYIPSDETDMVRGIKRKQNINIRLYHFNKKYRTELTIDYI